MLGGVHVGKRLCECMHVGHAAAAGAAAARTAAALLAPLLPLMALLVLRSSSWGGEDAVVSTCMLLPLMALLVLPQKPALLLLELLKLLLLL